MLTTTTEAHEPTSDEEAIINPAWEEAMQKEFNAYAANQTWETVKLPLEKKQINCTWVYVTNLQSTR